MVIAISGNQRNSSLIMDGLYNHADLGIIPSDTQVFSYNL